MKGIEEIAMRYEVELDEMTLELITRAVDRLGSIPPEERTVEGDIRRMAALGASCVLDADIAYGQTSCKISPKVQELMLDSMMEKFADARERNRS